MMEVTIPISDWLPDAPAKGNVGCEDAKNCRPTPGGFGPFSDFNGSGETVSGEVKGAEQIFDNSGASVVLGGTDDSLFIRRTTITETAGLGSIGEGAGWDFAQFNDFVFAAANNNSLQYLSDVDSDNTWTAAPGSPPNATKCAKVGEFLMLGDISGAPSRIHWSSYNNPTGDWTPDRLTQAGFADLPSAWGRVQRIVDGRYGLIFQERAISRLTYVNPPLVWRTDPISTDRGTTAPFSVVNLGYLTYFLAQDGFYVTNGTEIQPIASTRINEWFFEELNQSALGEVHGAVDWQNEEIVWAFKSGHTIDRLLIFSWVLNRWSYAEIETGRLVSSQLDGVTIDELDSLYADLDSVPFSLDSEAFQPRNRRLAAFQTGASTAEYGTFSGNPLVAEWLTGDVDLERLTFIDKARPNALADEWDWTVRCVASDTLGASSSSAERGCAWDGYAPVRWEGKKVALRIKKPSGNWSEMTGVHMVGRHGGGR